MDITKVEIAILIEGLNLLGEKNKGLSVIERNLLNKLESTIDIKKSFTYEKVREFSGLSPSEYDKAVNKLEATINKL